MSYIFLFQVWSEKKPAPNSDKFEEWKHKGKDNSMIKKNQTQTTSLYQQEDGSVDLVSLVTLKACRKRFCFIRTRLVKTTYPYFHQENWEILSHSILRPRFKTSVWIN